MNSTEVDFNKGLYELGYTDGRESMMPYFRGNCRYCTHWDDDPDGYPCNVCDPTTVEKESHWEFSEKNMEENAIYE